MSVHPSELRGSYKPGDIDRGYGWSEDEARDVIARGIGALGKKALGRLVRDKNMDPDDIAYRILQATSWRPR